MGVALADLTSGSTSVTHTGATSYARTAGWREAKIKVVNGASNSVVFTVEGSADTTHWEIVGYGAGSSGPYTAASKTITAGSDDYLHLPPDDLMPYIRVNVGTANANGTTFRAFGRP